MLETIYTIQLKKLFNELAIEYKLILFTHLISTQNTNQNIIELMLEESDELEVFKTVKTVGLEIGVDKRDNEGVKLFRNAAKIDSQGIHDQIYDYIELVLFIHLMTELTQIAHHYLQRLGIQQQILDGVPYNVLKNEPAELLKLVGVEVPSHFYCDKEVYLGKG